MTWRKTLIYWLLFGFLSAYYVLLERVPAPAPAPEIQRAKLLPVFSDEIAAFTLQRNGRAVRCELRERRWRAVLPQGATVPHDLVAALVETLTEKQESEVMEPTPQPEDLKSYGLDQPTAIFEVQVTDGRTMQVAVGSRNPPRTAIYVQTSLSPAVMLAGLNVEYYGDLIFEAAFPSERKKLRAPAAASN